jgi:peptidyl-dipeptidase Dcp
MRSGVVLALVVLVVPAVLPARAQPPDADPPPMNPLLSEWKTPFGVPPFSEIKPEHYLPAFKVAIAQQLAEVDAIAQNRKAPTFANTIEALEACGGLLDKVNGVFGNLTSVESSDEMQAIDREVSPMLAAHQDDIRLNAVLFQRVKVVWDSRAELRLAPDQATLLEKTWKGFVRGGALLGKEQQERLRAINSEVAGLEVKFGDDVLKQTNAFRLVVDAPADLAGLPGRVVAGAADAAKAAGLEGKWVFTLKSPSIWPFLQYAENRTLREQIFKAYISRCDHDDEFDNKATLARTAALRAERAQLLGYKSHADFVLDENMARTPAGVYGLLDRLWGPAKAVAGREAADLQAAIRADGKDFTLEPWDWWYYTEKVRKARFDLDEQAVRPYFDLDRVREGAFHVANRLFGVSFTPLPDLPVYNSEVKAYEVKDADGSHLAVFYVDYHPRDSKRGGAWSNRYRGTWVRDGKSVRPIVVNCGNFSRPAGDEPALLSLDEVKTLYHELGHGLNAILSKIRYNSQGNVPRDFVELCSQIMENWATQPEVLKVYAKHHRTGETIPVELVDKLKQAGKFNQGFATVEYLAASYLDMDWHTLAEPREQAVTAFEDSSMAKIGLPREIVVRYRSPYFRHIFSGGYSAGYYSYIWSEVLSADAFEAFEEKDIFDAATARSFRTNVMERGASEEPMTLYRRFRGREPAVEPLLEKRGLR